MTPTLFDRIYAWISRHRRMVCILLFVLLALSAARTATVSFNNDVSSMLPDSPQIERQLSFLNNSDMAGTIAFSVQMNRNGPESALLEQSGDFAERLSGISSINGVITGIEKIDLPGARTELASMLPLLMEKENYSRFENFRTGEQISERLKQIFIMLSTPSSSLMKSVMRVDPAGWSMPILDEISSMAGTMGYKVQLSSGRFVDSTGEHALIVADTSVPVTDGKGADRLMESIDGLAKEYKDLDITVICGHKHTLSNEAVIKKDIRIAMIFVTAAFILLMLLVFRSYEALFIFASPFAAILAAVGAASLIYSELSLFMMGFAAVIAGIAVDYGIHAYTAFKTGGYAKLKQTAALIRIASLTTIGVFVSFYASSVQDYHELATFSIISILLCAAVYIFIIPHFWTPGLPGSAGRRLTPPEIPARPGLIVILWISVLLLSFASMTNLSFTTDLSSFDGSSRKIKSQEERFHEIWGGRKPPGVAVIQVPDIRTGMVEYERMSRGIARKVKDFSSLALVWPSVDSRRRNLEDWKEYWTEARIAELKTGIAEAASEYGFSKNAFRPFYELLKAEKIKADAKPPRILRPFRDRYVGKADSTTMLLGYFDDTPYNLEKVESVLNEYDNAYAVSREGLSESISSKVMSDMKKVSALSLVWVTALTFFFLRDIRRAALALVPAATAVPAVFCVLAFLQIHVTVVVLITLIVILGLSIDYGVFLSGFTDKNEKGPAVKAVTFSMLTTMAGTVGLLFASHPAMFVVGVTLVTGILAAYLSAMYCIPALREVLKR
ncbi:MAG: hypothetical protein ACQETC_10415 [Thermodesulfobacteriota bacterium]